MPFTEKQNGIFHTAYTTYLVIHGKLDEAAELCGDEGQEIHAEIDFCLHGLLLEIAASDGIITDDERQFVNALNRSIDEQNRKLPGYKRFLAFVTVETWEQGKWKYFHDVDISETEDYILGMFPSGGDQLWSLVYSGMVIIARCMIAIDDRETQEEINCFTKLFSQMNSETENLFPGMKEDEPDLDTLLSELDGMIGLSSVKEEVLNKINLVRINQIRRQNGLEPIKVVMHMVFAGNPGTGKTTVAELIAKIFKELGVVSKGQFVEKRRESLVGKYIGHTAPLVEKAVDEARGGILFIDDAYSLSDTTVTNDFGREAIDTLVPLMDKYREDLVVIVAGYADPMQEFMDMNEGLRSRFPNWINFNDYSPEEMQQIFCKMARENKFVLTSGAEEQLMDVWEQALTVKDFGNGRGVRNLYQKTIQNQTNRLSTIKNPSVEDLITICREDIPQIKAVNKTEHRQIGF